MYEKNEMIAWEIKAELKHSLKQLTKVTKKIYFYTSVKTIVKH